MNDLLLSQELAAVLAASYTLGIPTIHAAQAAASLTRPSLSITGAFTPYKETFRKGTLTLELRSRTGDETSEAEHQSRFSALYAALFGADTISRPVAKATLIQALATRAAVNLLDYGPKEITADLDGDDLRTEITLNAVWTFV